MGLIPEEFSIVTERLKELNKPLYSQEQIGHFYYEKCVFEFKAVAAKPELKEIAMVHLKEVQSLIEEIESKKLEIFNELPKYDVVREDLADGTSKLIVIEDPFFLPEKYYKEVTVEKKKELYKVLKEELMAYDELLQHFGIGSGVKGNNPFLQDQLVANAIVNFEFLDKTFISNDTRSQDDFAQLLTDEDLDEEAISKLRIKVGCNNEEAAYIFEKLNREDLFNVPLAKIHAYKCFYNSSGSCFENNITPYYSKFKDSEIPKKQESKTEIDSEVLNLVGLINTMKAKK